MISADQAWQIAERFAREAAGLLGPDLLAVYVVGSLAGGGYRPGRSDIDTILIVTDDCPAVVKATVRDLRKRYRDAYAIPKDVGAVLMWERELFPPLDPTRELVPEILRLKHQGVLIWGTYYLARVPEPSPEDFKGYARVFYPWLRAGIDQRPAEWRTVEATVNTVLYELRLWVWEKTGVYVLDKRRVIPALLDLVNAGELEPIRRYVDGNEEGLCLEEAERVLQRISAMVREAVPWSVL
ncbi:MAG TPA: hypothetical protein VK464_08845 [Symbiobacteriaceae bacterium]|jgi:predicted nucleotidyltransferase|nr:hypothetical protein [Symbiobacteriaceae bacterium]